MKAVRSDWLTNSFSLASGKEKTAIAQYGKMQYYCQKVSTLLIVCGNQPCIGPDKFGMKILIMALLCEKPDHFLTKLFVRN